MVSNILKYLNDEDLCNPASMIEFEKVQKSFQVNLPEQYNILCLRIRGDMMVLETKRLILREWNENDVEDLIEGLNNIDVSKWLAFVPYPYTKEDAERWIEFCIRNAQKGIDRTSYDFAVELKSEKKIIGGVSLDKINKFQGTAGGGVWINAKYHGQGYGTEAFGKRIDFAFNELKLRRLENGFLDGNPSSFRMQGKFGYKIEGMRRKAFRCMADKEIKDEYITGLLKDEWITE